MSRRILWSHSAGPRGARVRVLEKARDGVLYWTERGSVPRSLGHRDRDQAVAFAHEKAAQLARGLSCQVGDKPTVRRVLGDYVGDLEVRKSRRDARARAREELWLRYLGPELDLEQELDSPRLKTFIQLRRSGEINARGEYPIPPERRRLTRARVPEADVQFLRAAIHLAMNRRVRPGVFLMQRDPTRGFRLESEKNPRATYISDDRHEALLAVAEQVHPYLRGLLVLAHDTIRRIGAICSLRFGDVNWEAGPESPWGSITWGQDRDKMGREWPDTPISEAVRHELLTRLDIARITGGGQPEDYVFPAPRKRGAPVTKDVAEAWLAKAERLAGLKHRAGLGWHGYRRLGASALKLDHAEADIMRFGGWTDERSLRRYQKPDPESVLRLVTKRRKLRERTR